MTKTPTRKPAAPRRRPILDQATDYARKVVDGLLPAGPHVLGACRRHLSDLIDGPKRGLKWVPEDAEKVISFYREVLTLNGGEHEGKPFILLPWQAFIVGSIFGWKNADGTRRFRMVYVESGKGSGKSPLAAGVGLYMMTADSEPRAEIYAAATKKDQAAILFRDAVAMVRGSPALSQRLSFSGGQGREYNIAYVAQGSFFRPLSSDDGQSGTRPHCGLLDEIHEHKDANVVEMMRAGTKGRRQALIFMITNSGADRTGVCYNYHIYAGKICAGDLQDDSFFSYVCALDEGDNPFADETCWPKANPSLGATFGDRYLRELVTQARGMPAKEAIVRRLNFCEWTDAAAPWIDRDLWDAAETDLDPETECKGLPCYLGLDLSAKRDLTSLCAAWQRPDGGLDLAAYFWTPGDTMDERARTDSVPYRTWRDAGHIFAPAGRIVDKRDVALFVQAFCQRHNVAALAFDNAQMDDFLTACDDIGLDAWIDDRARDDNGVPREQEGTGLRLIRHGQGFAGYQSTHALWMPRSIGAVEDRIMKGTLRIARSPVLRWNSASAVLQIDPQGNRKWDKRKSTGRIDGMVAATMAVGAADNAPVGKVSSIWDIDGVW